MIRNAVAEALEHIYGPLWPWSTGFERSLPSSSDSWNPQAELRKARKNAASTGKAIPEFKFVFWQKLFTSRYDTRIWEPYLSGTFPNLDRSRTVAEAREGIYQDLETIRTLRNRIAHHEPIFQRDLARELRRISGLIQYRSEITAEWMLANQQVSRLLREPPLFRAAMPTQDDIARAAYQFWEDRRNNRFLAVQDWIRAERELQR